MSAPSLVRGVWPALILLYIVWGSTYSAISVVVHHLPPLLAIGARYVAAGLIVVLYLLVRHGREIFRRPQREYIRGSVEGIALVIFGNGVLSLAQQYVPSGVAALLLAATPIWIALLRTLAKDRPSPIVGLGIALGFVGVSVLVISGGEALRGGDPQLRLIWSIAIVLGGLSWAAGSYFGPRLAAERDDRVGLALQLSVGGVGMMSLGAATGERLSMDQVLTMPGNVWFSWLWLLIVGALIGQTAYVWLLTHAPISLVSTYSYVNPIVAVIFGVILLGEVLTLGVVAGGLIIVVGVMLIVTIEANLRRPRLRPLPD